MIRLGNGFYLDRRPDGSVLLGCEVRNADRHVERVVETEISADQWPQVVAGVSAKGKTAPNRRLARQLHGVE